MSTDYGRPVPEPPADAEDWTDEQWIEYLSLTDPSAVGEGYFANRLPHDEASPTLTQRAAASRGGSMLGAAMVGLHRAIYGTADQPEAVRFTSGEPDEDADYDVELDEESSVARVRRIEHGADNSESADHSNDADNPESAAPADGEESR